MIIAVALFFLASFASATKVIIPCDQVPADYITCAELSNSTPSCLLGTTIQVNCTVNNDAVFASTCTGPLSFTRDANCRFCWNLDPSSYFCDPPSAQCSAEGGIGNYFWNTCHANPDQLCYGSRKFPRYQKCTFCSNKRKSTAVLLSAFLGGFGIDRFYLGDIGYGFFKMLTFGGFGVWSVVDFVLIATGDMGPADGGLYVS